VTFLRNCLPVRRVCGQTSFLVPTYDRILNVAMLSVFCTWFITQKFSTGKSLLWYFMACVFCIFSRFARFRV